MAHYLFNVAKRQAPNAQSIREQATACMRVKLWGVNADEPHRDALAANDLALIYLAEPERAFIGRAELGSAVREWTPVEAQMYPGDYSGGVTLAQLEEWDPPVPIDAVVRRIDPTGSNPYVQANARAGFRTGVVLITADEYEAVLAVQEERARTSSRS